MQSVPEPSWLPHPGALHGPPSLEKAEPLRASLGRGKAVTPIQRWLGRPGRRAQRRRRCHGNRMRGGHRGASSSSPARRPLRPTGRFPSLGPPPPCEPGTPGLLLRMLLRDTNGNLTAHAHAQPIQEREGGIFALIGQFSPGGGDIAESDWRLDKAPN